MQIGQPGFISTSQTSNATTKCNSNGNKVHSKQRHERPLRSIIMTRTRRTNTARFSRMRRGGKVRFEQKSWRLCKFDTASSRPATATTRGAGTPRGSPTSVCRQPHRRARVAHLTFGSHSRRGSKPNVRCKSHKRIIGLLVFFYGSDNCYRGCCDGKQMSEPEH